MKSRRGIAAILIIVVLGTASLLMALYASLLGIGDLNMGYAGEEGGKAFAIADGCLEETLRRIRLDVNYSGGTFPLEGGSCDILIAGIGSGSRTVTITGSINNYYKHIQAALTLTGNEITLTDWRELSI
ncbi:MAG: hypothetical protein HYT34_01355 [Candidatus Ryanbacteria bacterium]|nr:hypothetical protein [Candidatus Ryanbacteria bacterium]